MKNLQPATCNLQPNKGFTLLEILLVVAAIAILAGIVILAINPGRQLAETRNSQRRVDTNTILNAVYQEALDNRGAVTSTIPTSATCNTATNQVCRIGGTCTSLVDLSSLAVNERYLTSIPLDPTSSTVNGTGYFIARSSNGRVTVCAPGAENNATISITR